MGIGGEVVSNSVHDVRKVVGHSRADFSGQIKRFLFKHYKTPEPIFIVLFTASSILMAGCVQIVE